MRLQVLGCSGGIGGAQLRTTSLLVGEHLLIDAGTGVGDLELAQLAKIDSAFITHAHMDHIAMLPLMLDAVGELRSTPLTVYATAPTRAVLENHIFNWSIWPDFSVIPTAENPYLRFQTIHVGQTIAVAGVNVTVLPAEHTVPAVGYHLDSGTSSLIFTGDTTVNDRLWVVANRIANLRYLLIETAFPDNERALAVASKHLCPQLLATELAKLEGEVEIYVAHLKPVHADLTMQQITDAIPQRTPKRLENGQIFSF